MTNAAVTKMSNSFEAQKAKSVGLARRHYGAGRLRDAQLICHDVLGEDQDYGAALHLLGLITAQLHRFDESAVFLRRAVKSCPNTPEFRNDLAVTLEALGEFGGAVVCYRRVVAQRPGWYQVWTNLSNSLLHIGDVNGAEGASRRTIGSLTH